MARPYVRRKADTYQSLASINHHFYAISRHVFVLEQTGFFPGPKLRVFQGLIRELQSMISHDVCDRMHEIEDDDMFEYGKIRIEWEHHLNPDRPAFTVAQPETQPKTNGIAAEDVPESQVN
jgi:hypothetical protein